MAITVVCKKCGRKLKAPDSAAGKRAKCPQCGEVLKVPEPVYEAEEVVEDGDYEDYDDFGEEESYGFDDVSEYDSPAIADRRPCPMCGEMIVANAAKCRYCGEIFDATLKRKAKKKKRRGSKRTVLAGRGTRLIAQIVDGLCTLVAVSPGGLMLLVGGGFGRGEGPGMTAIIGIVLMLVGVLGFTIYQWFLLSTEGQTVGKRMLNIRIVMEEDGSLPGFGRAVGLRLFVNSLFGAVPYLGSCYGLIDVLFIFGEEQRCIHDYLAGTIVIEA